MNNEDACLEDKIKGSDSASSSFTDVLDDDKALTVSKLEVDNKGKNCIDLLYLSVRKSRDAELTEPVNCWG